MRVSFVKRLRDLNMKKTTYFLFGALTGTVMYAATLTTKSGGVLLQSLTGIFIYMTVSTILQSIDKSHEENIDDGK